MSEVQYLEDILLEKIGQEELAEKLPDDPMQRCLILCGVFEGIKFLVTLLTGIVCELISFIIYPFTCGLVGFICLCLCCCPSLLCFILMCVCFGSSTEVGIVFGVIFMIPTGITGLFVCFGIICCSICSVLAPIGFLWGIIPCMVPNPALGVTVVNKVRMPSDETEKPKKPKKPKNETALEDNEPGLAASDTDTPTPVEGETDDSQNPDEVVNEAWTEIELLTKRVTKTERRLIPMGITNPLMQVFYSFIYSFAGHYYVYKHGLWKYLLSECGICCGMFCFTMFAVPTIFGALCTLLPPLVALAGFIPFTWYINDVVVNFFFARGLKRISYVEEHKMKGSEFNFKIYTNPKSGEAFSLMKTIRNVSISIGYSLFKRICRDFVIAAFLGVGMAFQIMVPIIGTIIFIIVCIYILALNAGYSAVMGGYLNRKRANFLSQLEWAFSHHSIILGYGLGSLVLYTIPFVQIPHFFFGAVGATRFMVHYEEKQIQQKGGLSAA